MMQCDPRQTMYTQILLHEQMLSCITKKNVAFIYLQIIKIEDAAV